MKIIFSFLALAVALLFLGCKKNDVKPKPFIATEVKVEPVYSKYTNDGYGVDPMLNYDHPIKIYTGDTLTYNITYGGEAKIASMQVYKIVDGVEQAEPVFSKKIAPVTDASFVFKYVVTEKAGEAFKSTFKPKDNSGKLIGTTFTTRDESINVLAPFKYENKRLYNASGPSQNSFEIHNFAYLQDLKERQIDSWYAFMVNIAGDGKAFVAGFNSGIYMGDVQFVKAPAEVYTLPEEPNRIALGMKEWGTPVKEVRDVQAGDVYAFKAKYTPFNPIIIYGLIRINEVSNDQLTSAQGGHDNDYIQFDIKYYPGSRF